MYNLQLEYKREKNNTDKFMVVMIELVCQKWNAYYGLCQSACKVDATTNLIDF